jgi:2,4-didehydro-3-deoxy-L-rhamnonate hydrolase
MKLVRYGNPGKEKPGLIDADGKLRDLSKHVKDIDGAALGDAALAKLRKLDPAKLPLVKGKPRLGCPVAQVGKLVAIGLNYSDHAAETGMPIPKEPIVFMKATSSIVGPDDDVMLPKGSVKSDWEVELGIVIGKKAQYVSLKDALSYVAGYCVVNDVSEREYQLERGPQWDKGKGCDTFGPIGPWVATRDEVPNPQKLAIWLELNGKKMQNGSTKTMIFGAAKLVSYCSQFMTLNPGDIITTGTPPGVAMGMKDADGKPAPRFLKKGDVMRLGIEGLGVQEQKVVAYKKAA